MTKHPYHGKPLRDKRIPSKRNSHLCARSESMILSMPSRIPIPTDTRVVHQKTYTKAIEIRSFVNRLETPGDPTRTGAAKS